MALQEYKCPNCAGGIEFNPGVQEMVCPYCGSVINIEAFNYPDIGDAANADEQSADWSYAEHKWSDSECEGMVVYSCNSCGGEVVGDQTLGASSCPFCGNPVVVTAAFSGALRPDLVIPFKCDKQYALNKLEQHYANKKLLPDSFKDRNHLEEVKGVYVPFWLYNADTDAHVEYRGHKIRTWMDRRYIYTETSHYQIIREGTLTFDAVPADGSEKIDDTLMESIEPYNMAEATDFSSAYLAGFYANKYDQDIRQCAPRVNERIKRSTVDEYRKTVVGYNGVSPVRSNIRVDCRKVNYALLPVWLLGSMWQGKNFLFAMNGQTGKLVGDLPVDKSKRLRYFWTIFGIIAGLLLLLAQGYIAYSGGDSYATMTFFSILISAGISAGISLTVVGTWTNQLKSVRPKVCARDYVRAGSLNLRVQRDVFLFRNVTRIARDQGNSSGRGGGGSIGGISGKSFSGGGKSFSGGGKSFKK